MANCYSRGGVSFLRPFGHFMPAGFRRLMAKRNATAAEKRHLDRVASLPCALCELLGVPQEFPTSVHHIREGQGMSERASHFLTIPLCNDSQRRGGCHQGDQGVHGDRTLLRIAKVDELDLLAWTIQQLSRAA